jgi:hypothetical protein
MKQPRLRHARKADREAILLILSGHGQLEKVD